MDGAVVGRDAVRLEVVEVLDERGGQEHALQNAFALLERDAAEVDAVDVEDVEDIKHGGGFAVGPGDIDVVLQTQTLLEALERRNAVVVHGGDFTVKEERVGGLVGQRIGEGGVLQRHVDLAA